MIDLFNRAKVGSPVVVLAQSNGDSPVNPRVASTYSGGAPRPAASAGAPQPAPVSDPAAFGVSSTYSGGVPRPD